MVLAFAIFVCLMVPAAAGALTLPGAISGTVTDAVSHESIEALEVCAFPLEGEEEGEGEWHCSETDEAGEYEISNLPAGEWGVEFWGRPLNYVVQYWQEKDRWFEADPVVVESAPVVGIDAELARGGEVQGTVLAASGGAPVGEVEVCAWGYPGESFGGCAISDSAGNYALKGLAPAEYEIGFYPWEGNFVTQYYDHKAHWYEADLVPVGPEEVVAEIDADLETGAQISGSVYSNATGSPLPFIYVCSIEATTGELWNCTETNAKRALCARPSRGRKLQRRLLDRLRRMVRRRIRGRRKRRLSDPVLERADDARGRECDLAGHRPERERNRCATGPPGNAAFNRLGAGPGAHAARRTAASHAAAENDAKAEALP